MTSVISFALGSAELTAIALIVTAVTGLVGSCGVIINIVLTKRQVHTISTLEKNTNSIKDALVASTDKAARAEGTAEGLAKGRAEGKGRGLKTEVRGQRSEGRGQKAEPKPGDHAS